MNVKIEQSWKTLLKSEFNNDYFKQLSATVNEAYLTKIIFPPEKLVFNAFSLCSFTKVKVVILGQDPYHGEGQAHGLAFSVPDGVPIPPSLRNIYKEIYSDIGVVSPQSGNLKRLATQGVLLLNSTLTVEAGNPGSHQGKGWEQFTDAVITKISNEKSQVVFLLWGTYAHSKREFIDESKHLVLIAPHPSPLSAYRGFFGCKHFSQTNEYLQKHGYTLIAW